MQAAHGKCSCVYSASTWRDWKGRSRTKNGDSRKDRCLVPWRNGKYCCFQKNEKGNNCSYFCSWGNWKKRYMAKIGRCRKQHSCPSRGNRKYCGKPEV